MRTRPTRRFRRPSSLYGLLAVVVALVSQLALGATVLPDPAPQTQLAALNAALILCQTGTTTPAGTGQPAPHRHADCALCPLSVPLAQPPIILIPAVLLPTPSQALATRAAAPPQARAPPTPALTAAYPRGPPSLA